MALRLSLQKLPNPSSRQGLGHYLWRHAPIPSRVSSPASNLPLEASQGRSQTAIPSKSLLTEAIYQIFPFTTHRNFDVRGLKPHQEVCAIRNLSWWPGHKPRSRAQPRRARLKATEQIWFEIVFHWWRRWVSQARSFWRRDAAGNDGEKIWVGITTTALGKEGVEIRVTSILWMGGVVADCKPAAAAMVGIEMDEVDWGPNFIGWPNFNGLLQSTKRPIRGSKGVGSWHWVVLRTRQRNPNSVGFRIWDPGDFVSTIELSGVVPKDNSNHSVKHEMKKEGNTGHCTVGTTKTSCLSIHGSRQVHRVYSRVMQADYFSNFENNPRMLYEFVSNFVMKLYFAPMPD